MCKKPRYSSLGDIASRCSQYKASTNAHQKQLKARTDHAKLATESVYVCGLALLLSAFKLGQGICSVDSVVFVTMH